MSVERDPRTPLPPATPVAAMRPWHHADKVAIYTDEALRIARFVREYPCIETGGELFGYWLESGAPVVSYILGPGRGSIHRHASFHQNVDWLQEIGTALYDRHSLQHIGSWHSHHRLGMNEPSWGDIRTVVRGIEGRSKFLLMIATLDTAPNSPVVQNYYLVSPDGDYKPLRLKSLPGGSPFRTEPAHPGEESVQDPAAIVPWCSGELVRPFHKRALERSRAADGRKRKPKVGRAERFANAPLAGNGVPSEASKPSLGEPTVPEGEGGPPSIGEPPAEAREQRIAESERQARSDANDLPAQPAPREDALVQPAAANSGPVLSPTERVLSDDQSPQAQPERAEEHPSGGAEPAVDEQATALADQTGAPCGDECNETRETDAAPSETNAADAAQGQGRRSLRR